MLYPIERLNDINSWHPDLAQRMWEESSEAVRAVLSMTKPVGKKCQVNPDTGEATCPICKDVVELRDGETVALCSICEWILTGGDVRDL